MLSTSDYAWTPTTQITTDAQTQISFQATLTSTGDLSPRVTDVSVSTSFGRPVTVLDDSCVGHAIPVGTTCTITVDYDPAGLTADAPTLVDAVNVDLTTNSGLSRPFAQPIQVTGVDD